VSALFVVKIVAVYIFQDEIGVWEDDVIAKNMLETGEMFYMQRGTPNYMFQFPVYPSLLFGIYKLFGYNQLYGIVFNLLMISIISFLLFEIFIYAGTKLGLKPGVIKIELIAFFTVLSFLFHPFISFYSMFKVHPFIIDMFFPITIIFFSFRFLKLQSWRNLCLLAFSTGLGVLNRSTAFSAFIPFIILAASSLTLRKTLFSLSVVSITTILVISPWLMRGYSLYNSLAMTMTGNEIIWKGSLYNSDGSNYLLNGRTYKSTLSRDEIKFLSGKPIIVQNDFFKAKYSQLLREDPQHVFKLYFTKLKNFWLYHKNIGIEYGKRIQSFIFIYKGYTFIILVLNLGAIVLFKFKSLVLLSYPIILSIIQSIFYVETRHRMIIEPFLLFIGILTIIMVWERFINLKN